MESHLVKYDQFDYSQIMPEANNYVDTSSSIDASKTNVYDDYLKLMKYLEINENTVNCFEPLYPGVSMIYPINAWTFWYRDPTKSHLKYTWEESLTKIGTVRDITRLWKILNHIVQSSVKLLNASLFVFNENSVPIWEHKSNENAGRWIIVLNNNDNLHNIWNNMILQVVGDKFTPVANNINGIGLHIKSKCSKITVWTARTTLDNYKKILEIGIMSRNIIGPMVKRVYYEMHNRQIINTLTA